MPVTRIGSASSTVGYVLDEKKRPTRAIIVNADKVNLSHLDVVFQRIPPWMRDPRWDEKKQRWKEASPIGWLKYLLLILLFLFVVSLAHAQQPVNVQRVGGTTVNPATGIPVVCTSGCGGSGGTASSFGSAFPATGTASGFQPDGGGSMTPGLTDGNGYIEINCKTGCSASSASDTVGATVSLNALNVAASVVLAGQSSASVFIAGGGTLAGTLVPEVSNDGGTTWFGTFFIAPATGALSTSQVVSSPSATMFTLLLPGGADRARVRVSAFTSGASSATLKATAQKQSYPLKVSSAGVLSVDGSAVTQPISAASLPLPTGAAQDSSLTTIDTDLKANITLHAGSNIIGKVGIDQTTPGTTNAVAATNFPTTVDTNSGNKSASTLRVVLATDQPALTNKLLVTPDANSAVNEAQIAGQTVTTTDNGTQAVAPIVTASSTAAASACNILSTASTNSTSCKGSAGNFYGYEIYNNTTTVYYLRLYNTAGAPTCSSSTGFIRSIPIPPAAAAGQVGGAINNQNFPTAYGTGIGYCITGGSTSTDNTNAAAGVFGEIRYK